MKNFTSAFLELFKAAKVDKRLGFHWNGDDNLYPEHIEDLINDSVTALRCSKIMSAYIIGKGFKGSNSLIVNKDQNLTLFEFGNDIAESISNHRGVFIHVNYNLEFKPLSYHVLPFSDCRVGRQDSNKYSGKILLCDDWKDQKKVKKAQKIDVFNPDPEVVQKQIEAADGIEQYKGQIFYYSDGAYIYPLANLHPGKEDAASEHQASIYKNVSLKKGFFGKTLVITKPLVDGDLVKSESQEDQDEYKTQVTERADFRKTIQKFIGAENVDGVLHMEMEFDEKIEDVIMFKNIESNINDKLFSFTESSVRNNIRMCFNNVPAALIETGDGKLFGSSGSAIKEMKIFYQDQTVNERIRTTQIINRLMKIFKDPIEGLQITPLIDEPKVTESTSTSDGSPTPLSDDAEAIKQKAQASLKGSVGGVQALLQIQQSVKEGKTDRSSALTIIEEIFGIDTELAGKMLGEVEKDETIKIEE